MPAECRYDAARVQREWFSRLISGIEPLRGHGHVRGQDRQIMHEHSERKLVSNRWDRVLFPESRLRGFFVIIVVSSLFSLLLTGNQILHANWGLIDDHQVFTFLGSDLKLPANEIWSTLLTKTEVGQLQGRFRPTYYVITLVETWLFGPDVHLWYARNSICFALFLSALWWTMSRHVVTWLGGAMIVGIALLPLWADVWSRLAPSEIYGAAFVGVMLFAADAILFSERHAVRRLGVIVLCVAALVLAGLKETFLPLAAGGTAFVLILAGVERKLSLRLIAAAGLVVSAGLLAIALVVMKELSGSGVDFYGKSVGPGTTILHAVLGIFDALLRTWWVWILPLTFLQLLNVLPSKPLKEWLAGSWIAFAGYAFLIAMYAAQCSLYRISFPHNSRYDFPAMLLVPLTWSIVVCEVSRRLRDRFPDRVVDYAQLTAAIFLLFGLVNANLGRPPELAVAVKRNIQVTDAFFSEVQDIVRTARESPDSPIILDAYGAIAFEGIYSVRSYLRSFGLRNAISLRFHPDEASEHGAFANLQKAMSDLERNGDSGFVPLDVALRSRECLSVGLYGPSDSSCVPFQNIAGYTVTTHASERRIAGASR
jgi:hypothetical protein